MTRGTTSAPPSTPPQPRLPSAPLEPSALAETAEPCFQTDPDSKRWTNSTDNAEARGGRDSEALDLRIRFPPEGQYTAGAARHTCSPDVGAFSVSSQPEVP